MSELSYERPTECVAGWRLPCLYSPCPEQYEHWQRVYARWGRYAKLKEESPMSSDELALIRTLIDLQSRSLAGIEALTAVTQKLTQDVERIKKHPHIADQPDLDSQLAELRQMLDAATGSWRTVVRPVVAVGVTIDPATGQRFRKHGPGPVTVVTFYISHRPEE